MGEKMEQAYHRSLLDGTASKVPEISSKIVRVFISSTFSDMIWERNALMERVYPKLKDYCRDEHGLEFQAVDMRWGVHADAQNDHQASSLCLQEIRNCQELSIGPNFVILMGQKYGSRPFPTHIVQPEFELLLSVMRDDEEVLNLINTWFKIDENSVPFRYVLQPINSILTHFNETDPTLRAADEKQWGEIYSRLMTALRKAASSCYEAGDLDMAARDKYFISVTENEIQHGLLQYDGDKAQKCLCFMRNIQDISDNLQHTKSAKFIDMNSTEVDEEATKMLKVLKDEKIPGVLPAENISHYTVSWAGDVGINPEVHADYLNQFCVDFYKKMTERIDKSVASMTGIQKDKLLTEVVQHRKMAKVWTSIFHGREDVLSEIQKYVWGSSKRPFVIHGPSGSGKTAVMAKCASLTHNWLKKESAVVIIRFLGITPSSSGIRTALDSICNQLCSLYGKNHSTIPSDYAQLVSYFRELLQVASSKRPIVIYLDSVDQLSPANFTFKLTWLPKLLPANVKIVLSTLPDMYSILKNLQTFLKENESFVELKPLGNELTQETLFSRLQLANRTLTKQQDAVVQEVFKSCSLPLFCKVVFEEISTWKSYTPVSEDSVSSSIEGAIHKMLERLEVEHGKVLVSHALAYLTASRTGLTLVELEDLLSLDDEVLNSVFTYWLPPIRRIPPAILTRLRLQLQGYVVDREADGVVVVYWYHRKFIEVARDRYLSNNATAAKIHSILADYFMGTWGGGKQKPFTYSSFLISRLGLKDSSGKADRKVPLQPLSFHHEVQDTYNLRKLMELPQHLIQSQRLQDLRDVVLYSYDWYIAKIKAFSLQELLTDLRLAQETIPDEGSVQQVVDALRLGATALNSNPDCLSLELCGRLKDVGMTDNYIKMLLESCGKTSDCMLSVPFQCFDGPTRSLVMTLEGHNKSIVDVVFLPGKEMASFGWDGMICFWDLSSGELLKQVDASFIEPNLRAFLLLSRDGKYLVALNKVGSKHMGIFWAETGDLLHQYQYNHSQHLHKIVIGKRYLCVDFGILDMETGKVINTLNKYNVNITEYALVVFTVDDKHILIGSRSETAMYEIASCKKVFSIPGENIASQLKVTPDGRFALIGYVISCVVKVVDVDQTSSTFGQQLHLIDIPNMCPELGIAEDNTDVFTQEVSDINISQDGKFALALLKRFYLAVWNLQTPEVIPVILQHPDSRDFFQGKSHCHFSPTFTADSKYVVCYKLNGPLVMWDAKNGNFITSVPAHSNEIMQLKIDFSSNLMATVAKADLTIKLWNVDELAATPMPNQSKLKESYIQHLAIPPTYNFAISLHTVARYSREVYQMIDYFGLTLWNLDNGTKNTILPFGQYGQVCQMDCSENGEVLIFLMGSLAQRRIRIIDLKNSHLVFSFTLPYCILAKIHKNGKFMAVVTYEEGTYFTSIRACENGNILGLHENCYDVVFLRDTAVLLNTSGMLEVDDLSTSTQTSMSIGFTSGNLHNLSGEFSSAVLAVSKPTKTGLCRGEIVDVRTLQKLGTLQSVGEHGIVSLSRNGKRGIDSSLQVFDMHTFAMLIQLQPGSRANKALIRLLNEGDYAVWVDSDVSDLLKVCRVSDNTLVATCNLHATPVILEISCQSNGIVVGTNLGQILVFLLKPKQPVNRSETKAISEPSSHMMPELSADLQATLQDLAKQARMFAFNKTTLQSKTSTLSEHDTSSTCVFV
ncbi:NACHT and WD repeat domain-containing protein 2-like [Liolophura sinensis]|uniref:NACHT and WD repeat domain-containing protein 2-like n=1 Tax=Liolophura sinensis TaxID=3198878 RepID=UPI003158974F